MVPGLPTFLTGVPRLFISPVAMLVVFSGKSPTLLRIYIAKNSSARYIIPHKPFWDPSRYNSIYVFIFSVSALFGVPISCYKVPVFVFDFVNEKVDKKSKKNGHKNSIEKQLLKK